MIFWLILYFERYDGNLTDLGASLFPFSCSILLSRGSPKENSLRKIPSGLTYVSSDNFLPLSFQFEKTIIYKNKTYSFSPKIVPNEELIREITGVVISKFDQYICINLTIDQDHKFLMDVFNDSLPNSYVHRTLQGDFFGTSVSIINNSIPIEIFDPLPDFCQIEQSSFISSCENNYIGECEYSFKFRCDLLHWSKYPQNSDRGFTIGPSFISINNSIYFTNVVNMILPVPDISMAYNTPMIICCLLSSVLALIIRKSYL
jgi:hypothetical protein